MSDLTPIDDAQARHLVVLAGRVLDRLGQADLAWGHCSVRDPSGRGVWIKPGGLGFDEVCAADVILLGWDGEILDGAGPRHVEYPIHVEIMRARPDVGGVVHTHPIHAIAFAATGWPLRPLSHEGSQFSPPDVPRFDATTDVVNTPDRGALLVEALGDQSAVLMPGHGITTVGRDLPSAVGAAAHLERACQIQLLAGRDARATSDEEALAKRARANRRFLAAWTYLARSASRHSKALK
jgi:L-fuculose-phosphate aldolase